MTNRIFYFTATGNSLAFARDLAAGVGETELVSIAKAVADPSLARADGFDRVGLVFPVIVWGMPRIVKDFAKFLKVRDNQYVFAVATCGGVPGNTLRSIGKLLRGQGGHLDAGFAVRDAAYFAGGENSAIRMVTRAAGEARPGLGAERLAEITGIVRNRQKQRPEVSRWTAGFLGDFFHGMTAKMAKTSDKGYSVDERCDGCGICERICPRANVKLAGGKPEWHGDCEMCQACFQWCPRTAIQMGGTQGQPRNHRSGITLDDMLVR